MINNNKKVSKSFECKSKIIGRAPNNNNILDKAVFVPRFYYYKKKF